MYEIKDYVLLVNGVNTHLRGSGYYALNHWMGGIKKNGFHCTLLNTVPMLISAKDSFLSKVALFLYFFPGSLFRVFRIPFFELLYKISIVGIARFYYEVLSKNLGKIIFSHHSCFYLIFVVPKSKRILVIHDLLYVRSKSFGLPTWINRLTFAIELKIYKRCKLICVLSHHEYKLLSKFLNVKVELLSVCEAVLTPNIQVRNNEIALISDWRREENREGVVTFFRKNLVCDAINLTLFIYGYESKILLGQLSDVKHPKIGFIDRGSFNTYSEVTSSSILICVEKGAGIKLKVIEAICQRKYVLGTKAAFIGIPKKLLNNVSRQINCLDDCIAYIMQSNISDNAFEEFVKAYSHSFKNIGLVLKEDDKQPLIENNV